MHITDLKLTPIKTRRTTGAISRHIILQLFTDQTVTGVGEVADVGDYWLQVPSMELLNAGLRGAVVGQDPRQIGLVHHRLRRVAGMWPSLEAAVDMALYDISGRVIGLHASHLIGWGRLRDKVDVTYPIFPCTNPEHVSDNMRHVDRMVGKGWGRFRYYCGRNPDLDERFLTEFRDRHQGALALTSLDFSHCRYWKDALAIVRRLLQFDPLQVESVSYKGDLEGMACVRRAVDVMVSEHVTTPEEAVAMVKAEAVDVMVISIHSGGIFPALCVFAVALGAGLKCLLSTTQETSIGTAATATLGAVAPELHMPGYPVGPVLYTEDVAKEPVRYEGASLVIPDGPGLGVELDEHRLQAVASPIED